MTDLGIVLLLVGAVLLIAEAHVPSGVLGVVAGAALIGGGIILIGSLGGGAAVAVPVGVGLGLVAGGWAVMATHKATGARRLGVKAGAESLCGRIGVVRRWSDSVGQVFVDGTLWRARHQVGADAADALLEGDSVVVENVNGLTLSVRRAEKWELIP
jgi:membrane-bound serine protease (ClpP class)